MNLKLAFLSLISAQAFAGGAVVSGGKTNTAILVYENLLTWEQRKLVYSEIQNQLDQADAATRKNGDAWVWKLQAYESVTDANGKEAMCAAFTGNIVGTAVEEKLHAIAERAQVPSAVQSVGACRFFEARLK